MNSFFYTSASGRLAAILIVVEIALLYLLRRNWLSERLGLAQGFASPYLRRMWPHYWNGYVLVILSLAHAWVPMRTGYMHRANVAGLWLATVALSLLLVQVVLGLALQGIGPGERRAYRQWHYWVMVGIATLVAAHILLNA